MLFSTYGSVLDVVVMRSDKMRGTAHVTFKSIEAATQAMRALQGFEFFGTELVRCATKVLPLFTLLKIWFLQDIKYAKSKSIALAKLDGTYKIPQPEGRAPSPSAAATGGMTALQASIFNAPPSASETTAQKDAEPKLKAPPSGLPPKPEQGTKRPREDEDEESDVPMEEDDGSAMEESDED